MKNSLCAVIVILSIASSAFADQAPAAKPASSSQQQVAAGTKKIWTGIALVGAGAVALPVTSGSYEDFNAVVGGTLMATGMAFVLWGVRQRYQAANPSVVVGVGIGSAKAIRVTKAW